MNIFEKLIAERKIRTQEDLKRQYRVFAKQLHPDTCAGPANPGLFVKLRDDFEAALRLLPGTAGLVKPPTRSEVLQAFWDIEASGFPVDMSVRNSSRIYAKRIGEFADMMSSFGTLGEYGFLDVEREMYAIRGNDIIDNPLFGKIRMIFYNVVSWHLGPKKITKMAVAKWLAEIRVELDDRGFHAARRFLEWLVRDMDEGSALEDA